MVSLRFDRYRSLSRNGYPWRRITVRSHIYRLDHQIISSPEKTAGQVSFRSTRLLVSRSIAYKEHPPQTSNNRNSDVSITLRYCIFHRGTPGAPASIKPVTKVSPRPNLSNRHIISPSLDYISTAKSAGKNPTPHSLSHRKRGPQQHTFSPGPTHTPRFLLQQLLESV